MRARPEPQTVALAAVALLCVAFVASFLTGIRSPARSAAAPATDATSAVRGTAPAAGQVEVLNASGRSGLARHVTERLRDDGFDVVFFGNAPASAGDSTVVIDRTGRDAVARAVAASLGIAAVRTQRDTSLYLDATVIVGADWAPLQQPAAAERGRLQRALDRLRPGR